MASLHLSLFGHEIIALHLERGQAEDDSPGDCTTYPVGFAPSHGDQRWAEVEVPEYTGD